MTDSLRNDALVLLSKCTKCEEVSHGQASILVKMNSLPYYPIPPQLPLTFLMGASPSSVTTPSRTASVSFCLGYKLQTLPEFRIQNRTHIRLNEGWSMWPVRSVSCKSNRNGPGQPSEQDRQVLMNLRLSPMTDWQTLVFGEQLLAAFVSTWTGLRCGLTRNLEQIDTCRLLNKYIARHQLSGVRDSDFFALEMDYCKLPHSGRRVV